MRGTASCIVSLSGACKLHTPHRNRFPPTRRSPEFFLRCLEEHGAHDRSACRNTSVRPFRKLTYLLTCRPICSPCTTAAYCAVRAPITKKIKGAPSCLCPIRFGRNTRSTHGVTRHARYKPHDETAPPPTATRTTTVDSRSPPVRSSRRVIPTADRPLPFSPVSHRLSARIPFCSLFAQRVAQPSSASLRRPSPFLSGSTGGGLLTPSA